MSIISLSIDEKKNKEENLIYFGFFCRLGVGAVIWSRECGATGNGIHLGHDEDRASFVFGGSHSLLLRMGEFTEHGLMSRQGASVMVERRSGEGELSRARDIVR